MNNYSMIIHLIKSIKKKQKIKYIVYFLKH
jgi:hypothetical protein